MNFLQRIYKAEVIYEPNEKLEIKTSYFIRYFPIFFFTSLVGFVRITNSVFDFGAIVFGVIFLFQYYNIFLFIEEINANGKENFFIINNEKLPTILKKDTITNLNSNHYLQLFVKIRKYSINVKITNGAIELGKYRLNSTEDLKSVLDGLMEIGDLEMMESFNITNGEILQLKSKDKQVQAFSSLHVSDVNNIINILSIPNTSNGFQINRNGRLIKAKNKTYQIRKIERILIKRNRRKVVVFFVLKDKDKKVKIFTHKPVEVIAITDVRRLVNLLKNEKLLKNIEIEIFN